MGFNRREQEDQRREAAEKRRQSGALPILRCLKMRNA
jgi:hypothetical protein